MVDFNITVFCPIWWYTDMIFHDIIQDWSKTLYFNVLDNCYHITMIVSTIHLYYTIYKPIFNNDFVHRSASSKKQKQKIKAFDTISQFGKSSSSSLSPDIGFVEHSHVCSYYLPMRCCNTLVLESYMKLWLGWDVKRLWHCYKKRMFR